MSNPKSAKLSPLQEIIHEIIFEADTPKGKIFDIILLVFIVLSVIVVMLESVDWLNQKYITLFHVLEWIFTIFFTIEYVLRLYSVAKPLKYATSFFGIIDLLAILPSYIGLLLVSSQAQYLLSIRAMRLFRVFRIFKLTKFLRQSNIILISLRRSKEKIFVFLVFILLSVTILGSIMYFVEGEANPAFANIPVSIYWAIVTLTTVGYGDISPITPFGQFLAAVVMIMGYSVIAVPTGIVSSELIRSSDESSNTQACKSCSKEGHDDDAEYCKYCGTFLLDEDEDEE